VIIKKALFFAFACLVSVCVFLRVHRVHDAASQKKLTIVATTSIIADAIRRIVGDHIAVHGLMGPGVDPHLYRARESDVHKLAAADLIIYNGLHLEGKMGQVLEGMQRFTETVAVASCLDTTILRAADFADLYDPHIWFDVALWIVVVRFIQQSVIALDPINADAYKKNGDDYIRELEQLHAYVHKRVNELNCSKRILITAHDAFGYFGAAYDFEVVGLQGLSTDCDISTKDIKDLADYIVENAVPTIFVESSIPQRSIAAVQNAVRARGWSVQMGPELYSDALGDDSTLASSYVGMITYNIDAIVDSLKV
jgi:manganese/zinc/iron transport system substrate-binding protein